MKKIRMIVLGVAMLLTFPLVSHASMLDLQGVMTKATAQVTTNSGGTVSTQTFPETNTSMAQNMTMAFDNVSGIIHRGSISFGGTGMWIGFGGTALAPAPAMFFGNMQGGGVIRMSGDVTYNVATNTYTGSGTVVEFAGTVALSGMMKNGWTGTYGTPGAGFPGGGWMPTWGGGTGQASMMPGWGGMMSGWTSGPGGTSGWGMTGVTAASMMPGTGTGSTTPTYGGMMPGYGSGSGTGTIGVGGLAGMARIWVSPTSAAMINVTNGTPDYTNPVAVRLSVAMPALRMTMAP